MESGPPGDARFPDKDTKWVEERTTQKDLLVQWLEDFKCKHGENPESRDTIAECDNAISLCDSKLVAIRVPLMIRTARNARRKDGSCLEYGLKYHLEHFTSAVSIRFCKTNKSEI